jgi:hypothetical protein
VVESLGKVEPSLVDFGSFSAQQQSKSREVRVVSTNPTVHISKIKAFGSVPIHIVKSDDARSFRFCVEPRETGSFAATLDLELKSDDGKESHHETVRFMGQAVPTVSAAPAKVLVASADRLRKYRVYIQHIADRRVKLLNVACERSVEASAELNTFSARPRIELTVRPGINATSNATVRVQGVSEGGGEFSVAIPIVILERRKEGPVRPEDIGAAKSVEHGNREGGWN